jgi:UMF1 family MFS transporter
MVPRLEPQPRPRPELDLRHFSTLSKASKVSIPNSTANSSHSNEADDEQSLSDQTDAMEHNSSPPHYDGEDTRLTSDKELSGFYMYGWAAEVPDTL